MAWEGEPSPWSGAPLRVAARLYLRRFISASLFKTPNLGRTDRRFQAWCLQWKTTSYRPLFALTVIQTLHSLKCRDGGLLSYHPRSLFPSASLSVGMPTALHKSGELSSRPRSLRGHGLGIFVTQDTDEVVMIACGSPHFKNIDTYLMLMRHQNIPNREKYRVETFYGSCP